VPIARPKIGISADGCLDYYFARASSSFLSEVVMRKVSIRELLLLATVVALAIGLWVDHRQLADVNQRLGNATRLESVCLVFPPNSVAGARIAKTMQEAFSQVPGVLIAYDAAKGKLEIDATPGEQAAISLAMQLMEKTSDAEDVANNAVDRQ
jgi:hypothetical protein